MSADDVRRVQRSSVRLSATAPRITIDDPYRFWPTLGDLDLHLIGEGRHERAVGGARRAPPRHQGVAGTAFAVWAPRRRAVRVVGDFNLWDGRVHPMRSLGSSGVWELFVPGVEPGCQYKFEIVGADGRLRLKADPMARATEVPPGTASASSPTTATSGATTAWIEHARPRPT